jgi:hypothetical protein
MLRISPFLARILGKDRAQPKKCHRKGADSPWPPGGEQLPSLDGEGRRRGEGGGSLKSPSAGVLQFPECIHFGYYFI